MGLSQTTKNEINEGEATRTSCYNVSAHAMSCTDGDRGHGGFLIPLLVCTVLVYDANDVDDDDDDIHNHAEI